MSFRALLLLFVLAALPVGAQPKTWRSADGTNSFEAKFVSTDGNHVTLLRGDGRLLTFSVAKLHPDDQRWEMVEI